MTLANAQPHRWLRRKQAGLHIEQTYNIPCSEPTLATWATRGGGPPYTRVGHTALYAVDDLDAWALEKLSRTRRSTSEERSIASEPRHELRHVLTREPARA
jgi:hypothetical protein